MRVPNTLWRFPFCVGTVTQNLILPGVARPDGSFDPRGMDYAIKWWRRVKTWRMTHTLQIGGVPTIIPQPIDFDSHNGSVANELDLIRPATEGCRGHDDFVNLDGTYYDWTFTLFRGLIDAVPVDGAVAINDADGASVQTELYLFETASATLVVTDYPDSIVSAATMTIDGVDRALREFPYLVGQHPFPGWTGNITFTPIEFWPMAQANGENPIYDALTGALLIPTDQPLL